MNDEKQLRALASELWKKEKFDRNNPIYFIKLNTAQQKFFDCTNKKGQIPRRLIFIASNKQGKTAGVVLRGIGLALGEHPFLPEDHPLKYTKDQIPVPNVGLVVGERLTQHIDKKIVPEFLRWLPDICEVEGKKNPQGIITRLTIHKDLQGNPLGSIIYMRSYIEELDTFEGIDYHYAILDEPPPHDKWVSIERGLIAYNGISSISMTSLKEPWIRDFAESSIDYGGSEENVRVIEGGSIYENTIEKGGFLTKEAIDEFVKIVPAEQRATRIWGQWMTSGTVIYGSFQDEFPWVVEPFDIPDHWTKVEALDPADAKATQWIFGAVSPQDINVNGEVFNRVFITDHLIIPSRSSVETITDMVNDKRHELKYHQPSVVIIDAKHGRRESIKPTDNESTTWQSMLEDAGLGYVDLSHSNPGDVEIGHKIVRAFLEPQFSALNEAEVPGVVFFDRCRGEGSLIEGMKRYRYRQDSQKPEEKYKDCVDPLRYLLAYGPLYLEGMAGRPDTYYSQNRFTGR